MAVIAQGYDKEGWADGAAAKMGRQGERPNVLGKVYST